MATQPFALDKLPFGWFDFVFVAVLGFGLFRGRRNGMTKEVLPMLQSVVMVVVGGLGYVMTGLLLTQFANLDKTPAFILGYLILALLVFILFLILKKIFTPWLTGSNLFGGGEYYLGMFSGMIRFFCLLLVALALLHAPFYTTAEIKAREVYVQRWYGANYFPGVQNLQEAVFEKSLVGRSIQDYLGVLLISTAPFNGVKPPVKTPVIHLGN